MSKPILPAAVIAVALLTSTVVAGDVFQLTRPDTDSDTVVVKDRVQPLATRYLTYSVDPDTIIYGTSVACTDAGGVTTENGWWRLYDLDDDHGIVGTYVADTVSWGTQLVVGSLNVKINLYCLDEGLPFLKHFLALQDTAVVPVANESLVIRWTPISGSCDSATQELAIEVLAEDCRLVGCTKFYVGMNDLGQTAPTYLAAESCGHSEPTDVAQLGYPDAHFATWVKGQDEAPPDPYILAHDGDGGDVPATTGVGAVLLLLILLGSGAYFLRGRAAN